MSVVNCEISSIRPKYQNLKEWMADPTNVYIGRACVVFINAVRFHPRASPFCNPYKIGIDGTRDEVIEKYRKYILEKLNNDAVFKKQLLCLKGKTLGCWCKPEPCHGDVLLDIISAC